MKFLRLGEKKPSQETVFRTPETVWQYMRDIEDLDRESVFVIHLDTRLRILHRELVSLGTLTGSIVKPREIFRRAIIENSAAIVLVHNHPSGDPTPSKEDFQITKTIKKSAEILCIDFLDHIIIGNNSFYSFQEAKYI